MDSITMNKRVWLIFYLILIIGSTGCKNQQKIAEEADKVKTENAAQAKAILNSILNDDGQMTLAEKEKKLRQARALNSDDSEVQYLISQVEKMLDREREAQRLAQEPPPRPDPALEDTLSNLFGKIAAAGNTTAANNIIEEGLTMFSSPQVPVLIIISKSGNLKDYDEPTTILRYLNYLKDQQTSPNLVHNLVKDDNGKINELELIKKSNR